MPQQQAPFLEGKYGWNYGESGWDTGMNENLLKFSFMFDGNVDSIVASLPPVSNGAAHFNSTDNRFYFGVGTVWYSSPCPKSFIFKIKSNGDFYQFNGTSAVKIDNPSEVDSRLDAVELTLSSLGTAAFQNVEYFATQAELDVVEGQAQGYTDALRNDLANSTDPVRGAGLVGRAVVAIASFADLLSQPENSSAVFVVRAYYAGSSLGGGHFVWQAAANRANADGIMVIDPSVVGGFDGTPATLAAFYAAQGTGVGTGCWVRVKASVLTPESCGALGDGSANDAVAIAAWWKAGLVIPLEASGHYVIASGVTTDVTLPVGGFFRAIGRGAIFEVTAGRAHTFRVIADAACTVDIDGFEVRGNNKASNGIYIQPAAGDWLAERISVKNCTVTNIRGLVAGYWSSSVSGIAITAPAKLVEVAGNIIEGVNRDYGNPGLVSSIGILVTRAAGSVRIHGNRLSTIQSPPGEVDADAVVVFSRDVELDVAQDVAVHIYQNYIAEFKVRGVKLQTTEAYVTNNRFENKTLDITNSTRCIDSQFGGISVVGNYWELGAVVGAVPGADVLFVVAQHRATARKESRVLVADNFLTLDREIRYLVFQNILSGNTIFTDVRNNTVKAVSASGCLTSQLYRQAGSVANFTKLYVNVDANTYPSKSDTYVMLDQSISTSQANAEAIEFTVTNNKNIRTVDVFALYAVNIDSASLPYLGKMRVSGNSSAGSTSPNRINCTSIPIANILPGSNFYLNAGTIVGAPVGFTGQVQVEVEGSAIRLTATNVAHRPTPASAWRLTTTTAL